MPGSGLTDLLSAVQNGVAALNTINQLLSQATSNSSSLRVNLAGVVTQINSGTGLTGGPVTGVGTLAVSLTTLTNSINSDIAIPATGGGFVTGPTVSQGSSGTWLATGQATVFANGGAPVSFVAKLWDGTTVIDSGFVSIPTLNFGAVIALSGVLTSPSSNLKISVASANSSGLIEANGSGGGKDSTLTVIRIG